MGPGLPRGPELSRLRELFKTTSIYGSADFVTKAVAFLLIPVFTYFLSVHDYGRLALYQSLLNIFSILFVWGSTTSLASFYHFKEYSGRFEQVRGTAVRFLLAVNIAVGIGIYFISGSTGMNRLLTVLVLIIAYLATVRSVESIFYIHSGQPKKQFVLVVTFSVISALFIVSSLFLWPSKDPVAKIFAATALAGVVFFVVIVWRNRFYAQEKFDWHLVGSIFAFGLPLLPHALAQWTLNFADRVMLKAFIDFNEVGLYSLGYNFGMVMLIFLGAIGASWGPIFMSTAENEENAPEILGKIAAKLWIIICISASVYVLWVSDLVILATPVSYHSAIPISKWIIISYAVYGSYLLYANGLFVARKSRLVPLATVVAATINVLLNFILIPQYGSYGAVLATAVSFTTMSAIIYRMATKHYPLDVEIKFLLLVFLIPTAYFAVSFYLDGEVDTVARLIVKTVLTLIAGIFLYARIKEPRPARQVG